MAAFFYSNGNGDVFQTIAGDGSSLVNVETLDGIIGADNLAIYTEINIQTSEITQMFPTFNDVIHYLHFGKGVGSINIGGILFSNCEHNIPGLTALYGAIQSMRGTQSAVSMGGISFYAIVTNTSCTIMGEPDTMAQFQITMQLIQDSMGST